MQNVIAVLRRELPPVFAGPAISKLTGNAIIWGTIQNRRSRREIPEECFARSGTRLLVIRDPFLDWWVTTLTDARQPSPSVITSRRGRRQATGPAPEAA